MKNIRFTKTLLVIVATLVISLSTINPKLHIAAENGTGIEDVISVNGDEDEGSFIY